MLRGEALEAVERAFLLEHLGIGLQRERGVEDAGAAAIGLLLLDAVRGAVGAEEEFRRARGRRPADRQPVPLALGDGQAISVRPEPAGEQRVAVDDQVLGRDGRGDLRPRSLDERHRLGGGDVLEDDLQAGQIADQRREDAVDEHGFAVEDVDVGIGHLAMDQQRHADRLHRAPAPGGYCRCR